MRSRRSLLFVVMHIAGFGGAVSAQTLDQHQCLVPDPELSINRCTDTIQSGHETQQNLARAVSSLRLAHDSNGQDDRGIEDLEQASRLNPNVAFAFRDRGTSYARKGQYDRAVEDLDQAIRLNPNDALAFANRGLTYS